MVKLKTNKKIPALIIGTLLLSATQAHALQNQLIPTNQTNPPIGHYEFCERYASECGYLGRDNGPMQLTRPSWAKMVQINNQVNSALRPLTDMQIHGVEEHWSYQSNVGDCEDYVLIKRKMLMQAGFSPADLLITVVLQPDGAGHAVLTVRTDYGDYVLDNMTGKIKLWHETGYRFIKRQSSEHAGAWVQLASG